MTHPASAQPRTLTDEGSTEATRCADYARIAVALTWLAVHREERPALADLAAVAGLSPSHLQRVFTRWVGLSPKKFLQYLTLDHARARLADSATVLDAAWDAGLSGPGRLHHLFVVHAAVTPGEYRRRGEGLVLRVGFHPSPFGTCLAAITDRGLCALTFVDGTREDALADLSARFPRADVRLDPAATAPVVAQVFRPHGPPASPRAPHGAHASGVQHPPALDLRGTAFQLQVWEALMRVPEGALVSYEGLAAGMARPGHARAVASAVAANPVACVIPCHRVIRSNGLVSGYRWGAGRKLALQGWEASRAG